jgi:hypothetical protein
MLMCSGGRLGRVEDGVDENTVLEMMSINGTSISNMRFTIRIINKIVRPAESFLYDGCIQRTIFVARCPTAVSYIVTTLRDRDIARK